MPSISHFEVILVGSIGSCYGCGSMGVVKNRINKFLLRKRTSYACCHCSYRVVGIVVCMASHCDLSSSFALAAAAAAVVGSGPPSRVSSEGGDGGLVGGKSNEIYPLCLTFRGREGLGTCVVATLVVLLLRWTRWVLGVTRRVLPLLATSKMVFDVTRRGETLLVMLLFLQKMGG